MMRTITNMRSHLLSLLLVAAATTCWSQDSQEVRPDLKSDVLEWVDELDAPSLSTRKAAEKSLIDAGPDALPFLPEAKPGVSIEAAERLSRVRKALQAMRTKTETRSDAIRIHLDQATTLG